MAIAFRSYGTTAYPGYGSSPGLPTGYQADDILILCGVSPDATPMSIDQNSAGWTEIFQHQYSTSVRIAAWWRRATGSEAQPRINDGNRDNGATAWITAWSGVPSGVADPIGVVGAATDIATTDGTQEIAGVTTPSDGAMVIAFYGARGGSGLNTTSVASPLTGYCRSNFSSSNGSGSSSSAGYGVIATAGATGNLVINTNSQAYPCTTIAIALIEDSGDPPLELSGDGTWSFSATAAPDVDQLITSSGTWGWSGSASIQILGVGINLSGAGAWAWSASGQTLVRGRPYTRLQIAHASSIVGNSTPSLLVDGRYKGTYDWPHSGGAVAAIDLGVDATRTAIRVDLSCEDAASGYDAARAEWAFSFEGSANSTNGTDGDWTELVAFEAPDGFAAWQHYSAELGFAGYRWLRFTATDIPAVDELEVWDATSETTADAVVFLGDSITVRATKRGDQAGVGQQPSFQTLMESYRNTYCEQIAVAKVGEGAAWVEGLIAAVLAQYSHAKYWLISIGTNDANGGSATLPTFAARIDAIADAVLAAGHVPMFARIPYTTNAAYGGGGPYGSDDTALYNSAIDDVVVDLGLPVGPDLYALAYENLATFYDAADGGDSVHPGREGCRMWNKAWIEAVNVAMIADSLVAELAGTGAFGWSSSVRPRIGAVGAGAFGWSSASSIVVRNGLAGAGSWVWAGSGAMAVAGELPLAGDGSWGWTGEGLVITREPVILSSNGSWAWSGSATLSVLTDLEEATDPTLCKVQSRGPLRDASGAPLVGYEVRFIATVPQTVAGSVMHLRTVVATTDDDGRFSVDLVRGATVATMARDLGFDGRTTRVVPAQSAQDFAEWV